MAITKVDISMLEDVSGANNLVKLDANGKIPAGTGANLLNKPGALNNASDPTVSSNKTLGTQWVNTTSGEMYICTDATTGANVWKNVGKGLKHMLLAGNGSYTLGGTVAGFSCGGLKHSPTNSTSDRIDRYAFASSSNSTDHANLAQAGKTGCGSQSTTHGYCLGGTEPGSLSDMIQKFAFASGNATDTGYNLSMAKRTGTRQACTNATHAYVASGDGFSGGPNTAAGGYVDDTIEKFALSTDSHASDHGDLNSYLKDGYVASGVTHGFYAGGGRGIRPYFGPAWYTVTNIEYFAYAANTKATYVVDLTQSRSNGGSWTGPDYGYAAGGSSYWGTGGSQSVNTIDKYALVSGDNATDVGNLLSPAGTPSGAVESYTSGGSTSSTTHGYYTCGGGGIPIATMIQRCAFASDGNATDVGDMTLEGGGGRAEAPYSCWD